MKFSLRYIFVLVTMAGVLSAMFAWHLRDDQRFELMMKQDDVRFLIYDYISDNQGRWPTDWASLQPYFQSHPMNSDSDWENLTEQVTVDFTYDRAELLKIAGDPAGARPFKLFREPRPTGFVDIPPMILDYYRHELKSQQMRTALLILFYIRDHQGEWPPDWASLRPYFPALTDTAEIGKDFQQLTEEVTVDFSFDMTTLNEIATDPTKSCQFEPIKFLAPKDRASHPIRRLHQKILQYYRDHPGGNARCEKNES